ncbi:MAG: hypothetical protein ACYTG1_07970 [Planctomycetota bacterium]|jgi:hypothetical protein
MRGLCHVVYWLGLVLWTASLVTAGLTAMVVFSRLGDVPLALDEFAAWPAEQHGRIAAGLTMADVFFVVDLVQFVAAPAVLLGLAGHLLWMRMPLRRPAHLVRTVTIVAAAGGLAWYATALAPPMNADLRAFWDAAAAGDHALAGRHRASFDERHVWADGLLKTNLMLLLIAIAASAVALAPSPPPGGSTR